MDFTYTCTNQALAARVIELEKLLKGTKRSRTVPPPAAAAAAATPSPAQIAKGRAMLIKKVCSMRVGQETCFMSSNGEGLSIDVLCACLLSSTSSQMTQTFKNALKGMKFWTGMDCKGIPVSVRY